MNKIETATLKELRDAVNRVIECCENLPMVPTDPTLFPKRQKDGQVYDIILLGRWGIVDLSRNE